MNPAEKGAPQCEAIKCSNYMAVPQLSSVGHLCIEITMRIEFVP